MKFLPITLIAAFAAKSSFAQSTDDTFPLCAISNPTTTDVYQTYCASKTETTASPPPKPDQIGMNLDYAEALQNSQFTLVPAKYQNQACDYQTYATPMCFYRIMNKSTNECWQSYSEADNGSIRSLPCDDAQPYQIFGFLPESTFYAHYQSTQSSSPPPPQTTGNGYPQTCTPYILLPQGGGTVQDTVISASYEGQSGFDADAQLFYYGIEELFKLNKAPTPFLWGGCGDTGFSVLGEWTILTQLVGDGTTLSWQYGQTQSTSTTKSSSWTSSVQTAISNSLQVNVKIATGTVTKAVTQEQSASVATEDTAITTVTETMGEEFHFGQEYAGSIVWQWQYYVSGYGGNTIKSVSLALTPDRDTPPACLPFGFASAQTSGNGSLGPQGTVCSPGSYLPGLSAAPTAAPTASPSAAPSASPSAAPSTSPSASPTVVPTATPTASPTAVPTATPTASPTAVPTATPTASPTAAPTKCQHHVRGCRL